MKQQIKIDKGIPIPDGRHNGTVYPFDGMNVGDSFVVSKRKQAWLSSWWRRYFPKKFISRTVSEKEVRVWRIE